MKNKNPAYDKPFNTFIRLYDGNYKKLLLSFIFFVIKHSPVWIMPIVLSNLINIISNTQDLKVNELIINLGLMAILVITNVPATLIHTRFMSLAIRDVESSVRIKLVKKLQVLSIPYHKHLSGGKLQSKVLRDVELITNLSNVICITVVPIILNVIVAFSVTTTRNIYVSLFFLATIPISVFFIGKFNGSIQSSNKILRKNIEDMSTAVSQMVEMVPITRAHALENLEIDKVDNEVSKVKSSGYKVDMLNALFGAGGWATFQLMQIICLVFTSFLAVKGYIKVGDIVLYQTYFSSIMGDLTNAINVYPQIVKGFDSINSVSEILAAEDIEENCGKFVMKEVEGDFQFNNVTFRYEDGKEDVLKDFNLHVKKGESIAFVGESGGGKSTLLQLVVGFLKATNGQILVDGHDINDINLRSYRTHIAMVPQNTVLFSGSIKDNITYGMDVSNEKLDEIIDAACLKEVIERLPDGINTNVGEHGDMLSGGQKQRISIARALIRNPKVIILDEATSALDNKSEIHVQKAMKNLMRNRTTFMVAHRLSTIKDAQKIVLINGGNIREQGTYEELISKKGEFYNLASNKDDGSK
ncbi:MAG: ABC transporter ATP-binding protein [Clostridium butyricum]|nr:ABC transporter ATP-binding protein [Clostridium butyricum]